MAAAVVTRREAEDEESDDNGKAFDVDCDGVALVLLESFLTRFPCLVPRNITSIGAMAIERGCRDRRSTADENIMVCELG